MQPLLQWKISNYYMFSGCICRLRYAVRMHYCYLWPVRLYSIFPRYLIKGTIFVKKKKKEAIESRMCIFVFSATLVWNISHSMKNWVRYDKNCILFVMWGSRYSFKVLMKFEYSRQMFEKYSYTKFYETPSNGSRFFSMRTDGQIWRSCHFPQFCESA